MERITLEGAEYEKLLEGALSRIPGLCPDWKNTRESDPGVTLIQLMAALTDIQNYTVNTVSERHKEEYIRLLGGKKHDVKCALADVAGLNAKLIKGERIKIGGKVFEYSGEGDMFTQKETLVKSVNFYYNGKENLFIFPFWIALNGTVMVFERIKNKTWRPVKFCSRKTDGSLLIEIDNQSKKGRYRAVFYDGKSIGGYYSKNGVKYLENDVLEFGETSGVTMQKVEIFVPESNGIMSQAFKLWVNYGSYYEEIGFNPIKKSSITFGNGRDFPIPRAGGKIEAFSFVMTKGATSLSERQPVFYPYFYDGSNNSNKIKTAAITVLSAGKNAETADEALLRINEMLAPQTCVTAADYTEKIKKLCGSDIKKIKVISDREPNKFIIYALLNDNAQKPFSIWKNELLNELQQYKLLTVSLEIHEAAPLPVTVEGEIALKAGDGVEIQKEIERAVSELCENEIGAPINAHTLREKLSKLPLIKRINRLNVMYGKEIEDVQKTLTFLDEFSVNFIIS
ncbi:MAG: hypothetical protein LBC70_04015 [Chitinispirillales bacterium]|jgi:hypothetical protein|nr:hypothetical protein [Chitinispirillales bacterium]